MISVTANLRAAVPPAMQVSRRSTVILRAIPRVASSAPSPSGVFDIGRRNVLTSFLAAQVVLRVGAIGLGYATALVPPSAASAAIPEISSETLAAMLLSKDPDVLLVDVRAPEEVWVGSIKGSINVPAPVFLQEDTADLDQAIFERISTAKEVVIQCLLGRRAPSVAEALAARLQALGVSPAPHISVLTGGIDRFMAEYGSRKDLVVLPSGKWPRRA